MSAVPETAERYPAVETHTYKRAEGCDIRLDVHRPTGSGPPPKLVALPRECLTPAASTAG
jgi:hypothetical protein